MKRNLINYLFKLNLYYLMAVNELVVSQKLGDFREWLRFAYKRTNREQQRDLLKLLNSTLSTLRSH
jgi:hypothetical protein